MITEIVTEKLQAIEATLQGGILGIRAIHGSTGAMVSYRENEIFPTASTIKVAIVAEMYAQSEAGKLNLDSTITLSADDFVVGSGILASLEPGHTFTLEELARLTISVSDNTASNAILRAVGGPAVVNNRMHTEWQMPNTTIHRPIRFHLNPDDPPSTATGTPADMCRFMNAVASGELHSRVVSDRLMTLMAMCEDTEMIPRYLPVNFYADDLDVAAPALTVHHKPGAVNGVRNDAGVIRQTGAPFDYVALAIYSKNTPDARWTAANAGCEAVAQVAALVVQQFFPNE